MKRNCDGCTACCSALGVLEINKPMFTDCAHCTGTGCAIYENRPEECAGFECLWLADTIGLMREEERPDKIGIVFYAANVDQRDFAKRHDGALALAALEARSGATDSWGGQKLLSRLRRHAYIAVGPYRNPLQRYVVGPDSADPRELIRLRDIARRNAKRQQEEGLAAVDDGLQVAKK